MIEEKTFDTGEIRLNYAEGGTKGKPVMVFLHGLTGRWQAYQDDFVTYGQDWHLYAPDLRGHGDSAWAIGSQYAMPDYLLDLNQLLRHIGMRPVILVGHSLGGAIVLQYAGTYPDRVSCVVAIEGLGPPPSMIVEKPVEERLDEWIRTMELLAARQPRRYPSLAEAEARMREANPRLSAAMASHLTVHGTMRMEDGSYTWKFDNYVRAWGPNRYDREAVQRLWARIRCPALLVRGSESWAENPVKDGRAAHFASYRYVEFEGAGHWVHHDQLEGFLRVMTAFLNQAEQS